MTYQMLCLDIDGTLLNSHHEISPETKQAIQALPKGFPVILVSARMPKGMVFLHKELQLQAPMICYGGALVMEVSEDGLYQPVLNKGMTLSQMKGIYQQAKKHHVHIGFYEDDEWYIEEMDDWARQERDITQIQPTIIDFVGLCRRLEALRKLPNKALCMGTEPQVESLESSLKGHFDEELAVYRSKPTYLEMMNHSVTKTSAIRFLQAKFHLQQGQILAVGDGFNDIDMLQYAGLGVAMGNAPEQVQQTANEITSSNDDNGVAKVIEKHLI